jgi:hypothetical protein
MLVHRDTSSVPACTDAHAPCDDTETVLPESKRDSEAVRAAVSSRRLASGPLCNRGEPTLQRLSDRLGEVLRRTHIPGVQP